MEQLPPAYRGTLLGQLDERFLANKLAPAIFAILIAAALITPSVQFVRYIQKVESSLVREGGIRHKTALGRWLPTAELLASGRGDPYGQGHWFPTPPLVLMCLVPLSKLGYVGAGIVWSALKIAGVTGAMLFVIATLRRTAGPVPIGIVMMAAVFSIRPIISDIQHGNLNIFMMVWVSLAWCLYMRGQDTWAGLLLALAIVTKVTPLLVLVYFLYRREWRICFSTFVGLVLFVIVLPGFYLGFGRNITLLKSWFDMLVAPYALNGWVTLEIANQSLYGVLLRLLSNAHWLSIQHISAQSAATAGMEDMGRPAAWAGNLLRPAITLGTLALLAWLCYGKSKKRVGLGPWLQFALILLAMLLLGERTWKHHATTLPLVFVVMWYCLTCRPWSDRFRAWFVAGLVCQFLMLVAGSEGFLGDDLADRMLDGGLFCWGLLLCAVQIGVLIRRLPAEEGPSVSVTSPGGAMHSVPARSPQS